MKYNYRTGSDAHTAHLSHFVLRGVGYGFGIALGILAGLYCFANSLQVQSLNMQPVVPQNSLSVQPLGVDTWGELTEPNDIQPALGYNVLQPAKNPQVVGTIVTNQYAKVLQPTTSPQNGTTPQLPSVSQLKVETL